MVKIIEKMTDWDVTTIDILRHGEPEGGEIFRGSTDVALTALGFEQMQQSVDKFHGMSATSDFSDDLTGWQQIITSPLKRCSAYAQQLSEQQQLPLHVESDLREVFFGDWDGLSFSTVQADYPEKFDNYWRDPFQHAPPSGEPFAEFCLRTVNALSQCIERFRGQHVLLVTHGGVIRAILNHVLNDGGTLSFMRFEVPYACISRIRVYHDSTQDFLQLYFHNR